MSVAGSETRFKFEIQLLTVEASSTPRERRSQYCMFLQSLQHGVRRKLWQSIEVGLLDCGYFYVTQEQRSPLARCCGFGHSSDCINLPPCPYTKALQVAYRRTGESMQKRERHVAAELSGM